MQPIWNMCLDEIARGVAGEKREGKTNENVETVLIMSRNQSVEVLFDLLKYKL